MKRKDYFTYTINNSAAWPLGAYMWTVHHSINEIMTAEYAHPCILNNQPYIIVNNQPYPALLITKIIVA